MQPAPSPVVKNIFEKDDEQLVHARLLEFETEGKDRIEVNRALVNANVEFMRRIKVDGRPAASKWMLAQLQGKDLDGFVKDFGTESEFEPKN